MKNILRTIAKGVILLSILLTVNACNNTDDISEIFNGRTWYLTYIKDSNGQHYPKNGQLYSISFKNESFEARMPNGTTITGKWYADGGASHIFHFRNIEKYGYISGDAIAEKMYGIIYKASSYDGDTNWLQIKQDKETYMQFYNK